MIVYNGLIANSCKKSGKEEQEEKTKPKGEKDRVEMGRTLPSQITICFHIKLILKHWNSLLLLL